MNKLLLLLFTFSLVACKTGGSKSYKEISEQDYNKFVAADTLLENANFLITKSEDSIFKGSFQLLLKKQHSNTVNYYKFDSDCYFENDSVIISYAPPFLSDSENGSFQKNGIWVYAKFFTGEKKKGNSIYETSESGVRYSVDSIPPSLRVVTLPNAEGIYFYKGNNLLQISKEQSENKFYSLKKDGFYFIPNSGRLFSRISLDSIQ